MFRDRDKVNADVVNGHLALESPRKGVNLFLYEILDHTAPPEHSFAVGTHPPFKESFFLYQSREVVQGSVVCLIRLCPPYLVKSHPVRGNKNPTCI